MQINPFSPICHFWQQFSRVVAFQTLPDIWLHCFERLLISALNLVGKT